MSASAQTLAADPAPVTSTTTAPPADRAAVNRQNAQLSTGPRTEAGKLRSSLNALSHGLTARTVVLPTEDPAAYDAHCRRFFADLDPHAAIEEQLVQSLADTAWRLNRIPALEASLLSAGLHQHADTLDPADPDTLDVVVAEALAQQTRALTALSMNEARLSRQFDRTLKQLSQIQAVRRDAEAAEVHVEQIADDTGKVGFVLSSNPIDAYLARHALQETQFPSHPARPKARTASAGAASGQTNLSPDAESA